MVEKLLIISQWKTKGMGEREERVKETESGWKLINDAHAEEMKKKNQSLPCCPNCLQVYQSAEVNLGKYFSPFQRQSLNGQSMAVWNFWQRRIGMLLN